MKATFLKGFKPLVKTFRPEGVEPYPMVKNVTSMTYEFPLTAEGIQERYKTYKVMASRGACLLKGSLKKALENESRAGQTKKDTPSHSIILDFDSIKLEGVSWTPPLNSGHIKKICSELLKLLPEPFQSATYIAHPSASFGTQAGLISMHLEFFSDIPIQPKTLKSCLRAINLTNDVLANQMTLTATGRGLRWPVDICVADPSRMIFIGTPIFEGVPNPIPDENERFVLVEKENALVEATEIVEWVARIDVNKIEKKHLKNLQNIAGIEPKKDRFKTVVFNGFRESVVVNPGEIDMELHSVFDSYITYNVGGGDSHAYYVQKNNPSVVYNWKGEPPFLFQQANPTAYEQHIQEFGITGEGPATPIGFRDKITDTFYAGLFDPANEEFLELNAIQRANMDDFYAHNGGITPEPLPQINFIFNPQSETQIDWANDVINRWVEPDMMKMTDTESDLIQVENLLEVVKEKTPTIFDLLESICGDGYLEMERYLNWLAFIIQRREKTGVAWLFQGVQGTGKGVFYSRVLRRIFGQYAMEKTMSNLEDDKNAWVEHGLLCVIDEFKIGRNSRGDALIDRLKNYITEEEINLRGMRANQRTIRSFINFMMFTNQHDAMPVETSDRRMNICPRQEVPIIDRHPDIRERIVEDLPAEVDTFAKIMKLVEVSEEKACRPMENNAKSTLRETSMTSTEEFANAILYGEFDYFGEILERNISIETDPSIVLAAQNTLRGWLNRLKEKPDTTIYTTYEEIKPLYLVMVAKIESTRRMAKILRHKGVNTQSVRVHAGDNATKRICIKFNNWEPFVRIVEANSNAIPFHKENKQ